MSDSHEPLDLPPDTPVRDAWQTGYEMAVEAVAKLAESLGDDPRGQFLDQVATELRDKRGQLEDILASLGVFLEDERATLEPEPGLVVIKAVPKMSGFVDELRVRRTGADRYRLAIIERDVEGRHHNGAVTLDRQAADQLTTTLQETPTA